MGDNPKVFSEQEMPLYLKLADELREAITSGALAPGAQVPTAAELMQAHDVSRNTVRNALDMLENEGLITKGHARAGRRVQQHHGARHVDANRAGAGLQRLADPEIAAVPGWAADLLGIADGEPAVVRRHIDSQNPHRLCESWRPLNTPDDAEAVRRENKIESRPPEPDEQKQLSMPPGWPVIVQTQTSYSATGPLSVTQTIWPGNRTVLTFDLLVPDVETEPHG